MKVPQKIQKITTEEEQIIAIDFINTHNKNLSNTTKQGDIYYAYISVGSQHKMFTLWTYFSLRKFKPDNFITILSNNLVLAVQKAIERYPNIPIHLDAEEVYRREEDEAWKFLSFGKYKERHIDEIIIEDPEYAVWLLKENTNRSNEGKRLSKLGVYLVQHSNYIWDVWKSYRTHQAEEVVKTSTKNFIGKIGEISQFEVVVKSIKDFSEFYVYRMEDKDGNIIIKVGKLFDCFISQKGENKTSTTIEVGDTLKFSAKVKNHEISIRYPIGEKQTKIGDIYKY
jgi:hypothetical protein